MAADLNDFKQVVECVYKMELYSVRDNGAVLRHTRKGKRLRKYDNQWTFGKPNVKTGYMEIASVRVHRIVATAFHGEPPTKKHVVDHIDTNKRNNRPENLRWVTRFENVLLNPITVKRIELVCGCNIEEFLADPSKFRDKFREPNYKWMTTVSKEEAQASREKLLAWAESDRLTTGGSLGEWIFNREKALNEQKIEDIFKAVEKRTGISRNALCFSKTKRNNYYEARKYAAKLLHSELNLSEYEIGKLIGITANTVKIYLEVSADWFSGDYEDVSEKQYKTMSERSEIIPYNVIQKNWGTQSDFPCCPKKTNNNPIEEYAAQLKKSAIFFYNIYYSTTVLKSSIIDEGKTLLVMYRIKRKKNQDKRWGIMKIKFKNEMFVHEIIPNYNGTLEHYWLIDVENHFKSIIEGYEWVPLYDSQGREFKGNYMPL